MNGEPKATYASMLKENDRLFEQFFGWLAGQFDFTSGGFYYARSSAYMNDFVPDIESSAMALNIILHSGLLEFMPDEVRGRMIRFFQSRQDPVTGYFYDPDENMPSDEVMVSRALGYSIGALRKLGAGPLYPLPAQHMPPEYLESPSAYVDWLKQVDLRNSWRGCDLMGASAHHLLSMVESIRKPYMEAAVRYLGSIQDPETGLWGEGSLYIRISGTFKLRALYRAIGADIPNVDRIYQTILDCLRNEKAIDMCWVRNPIDLLSSFEGRHVVPDEELAEILEITFTNLRCFLKSDGGFSREIGSSPPAPNVAQVKEGEFYPYMPLPVRIGKGLTEGDMNAGTQAIWIRIMCHKLAGLDVLPLTAYTVDFWQNVMARSGRNIMNLKFRQGLTDSGC